MGKLSPQKLFDNIKDMGVKHSDKAQEWNGKQTEKSSLWHVRNMFQFILQPTRGRKYIVINL